MPLLFGAAGQAQNSDVTDLQDSPSLHESNTVNGSVTHGPSIPIHPLGVKPLGNQYFSASSNARESLGFLRALPDEVLMTVLEYVDQTGLRVLGSSCKFLFAFCSFEELWKTIFLESSGETQTPSAWQGTWRSTVLRLSPEKRAKIDCRNVFSDVLHRPFLCSHIELDQYSTGIPKANQIRRLENLSCDEFTEKWSDSPFILTQCIRSWPVANQWDLERLLELYAAVEFRAEAVDWPLSTYYRYMYDNQDESPLYLFDRKFAEKMKITVGREEGAAYWKPDCFGSDLFELLGAERPAHRWLIMGPKRSGSTFHKDPNGTSAWNAVLEGAKYWIMFPPTVAVPGVYVSKDNSEVTSPLSIAEWLLEFHEEARQHPKCVEGVCKAGEILHVPSGWWHLVVNLDKGVALTQNFVPKAHLPKVLSFLHDTPDQVTGFKKEATDPYGLFIERLKEDCPDVLEAALEELDRRTRRLRKRTWDDAVGGAEELHQPEREAAFTFGFESEEEEEDNVA